MNVNKFPRIWSFKAIDRGWDFRVCYLLLHIYMWCGYDAIIAQKLHVYCVNFITMYIMNYIERLAYVEVVNNPKTNYNRPCCFQLAEMN